MILLQIWSCGFNQIMTLQWQPHAREGWAIDGLLALERTSEHHAAAHCVSGRRLQLHNAQTLPNSFR